MFFAWLAVMVVAGYLCGSVSWAIIITRARAGTDIREMGNRNAGAANVSRHFGKGWGTLVLFLDFLKSILPMLAAKLLFFPGGGAADLLAVCAVGLAVILGHCRPVYFGFRGGGGMASSMPVYFFLAPVEFFVSMLLGALIVGLFIRNVQFRMARWIPIMFATIAPFLTLAVNWAVDIPIWGGLSIGGHSWATIVGVFAVSLLILALNARTLTASLRHMGTSHGEGSSAVS